MKFVFKVVLPVLLVAVIAWLIVRSFAVEVPVAQAYRGAAVDAVTGTIKLVSKMDLQYKTEVPGRLKELPVYIGTQVKKGDLLASFESRDLEHNLAQRRIQLRAATDRNELPFAQSFDLKNLQEEIKSLRISVESGVASGADLERRLRDVDKLEAALKLDSINRWEQINILTEQVKQLEYQLERMKLYAPFDGEIVEVLAFPGDWVWGGNAVVRIVSPGRMIEMKLSEEDYYGVEPGQKVTLHFAGLPGQTIPALVDFLSPVANADNKTRTVYLKFDESVDAASFTPGLTGEGVLVKSERANSVIIPRRALIGETVYVNNNGTVEIRQVKPGFLGLNKAEILEGIGEGELVILENQMVLRDGDRVKVRQ